MSFRIGVIDVGTNSVRLYLAERANGELRQIERSLTITRLGQGVDRDRRLHPEALTRTVDAVGMYWDRCEKAGVRRSRIAATSAVRDAGNREDFLEAVRNRTGRACDVLSGDEEAALSFAGATSDLAGRTGPFCVLDIGGGSTEMVVGVRTVEAAVSLDVGAVRLTERCALSDPPAPGQLGEVAKIVDHALEEAERVVVPARARILVGLAGTITTLAAITLGLTGYDRDAIHHSSMTLDDVRALLARLAAMTSEARKRLPAMPPGREDVIVAGTVILERVMTRFGFQNLLVSEADILDGLAASLL